MKGRSKHDKAKVPQATAHRWHTEWSNPRQSMYDFLRMCEDFASSPGFHIIIKTRIHEDDLTKKILGDGK